MISVCLASFNGERFIQSQLESILSQLGSEDELIVSDDNSTDKTIEVVESFKDSRIKLITNSLGKGYSKNFENAILHSKGSIIFLSDQDDIWLENKIIVMLEQLQYVDFVVSDAEIVDEFLKPIAHSHFILRNVKRGFVSNFLKTRYIGACMAFKREILKKALPFPRKQKYCAHDYWLTIIAEFYYKTKLLNEPLIKYRRHTLNASSGGDSSPLTIRRKISTRIYSLTFLFFRMCQ